MLIFSDRCTTRCVRSILNGLSLTAIVRHVNLTNRGLPSCSVSLCRGRINRSSNECTRTNFGGRRPPLQQHQIMSVNTNERVRWHFRRGHSLPLREAIPLWFAISSPLIGVVIGFLGAWFVTWLTT